MCGRYRLSKTEKYLLEHFGVRSREDFEWKPRYNIAPTDQVPVIRQDKNEPVRTISSMRWGLIPYWAKDASIGAKMINARSESLTEKPAFKDAIERRRCLVPADAFYEWKKTSNGTRIVRQPFLISMKDDEAFAFAGIWDRWKSPEGNIVLSVSILTTDANPLVRDVHDRMPVIVPREHYDLWLDPGFRDVKALEEILKPFPASEMEKLAVSSRVNSVKNDDPECASPAADEAESAKPLDSPRQKSLF
jgi:putative SOS response-associated peptidase YedK